MDSLAEITHFLKGTGDVSFQERNGKRTETYTWIEETLVKFSYALQKKRDRGILRRYIQKITGYSRAQVTRCITQYRNTGRVRVRLQRRHTFTHVYRGDDIALLAKTDELHDYPNGAALKTILMRMVKIYKAAKYERIANISVTHIYNMRHSVLYQRLTKQYEKTKPTVVNLGERRKPEPNGKPGYIRVDTVHQGDEGDRKGVYHINMIDEVTQFEVVAAVEKISEAYLIPVLEMLIASFPFRIIEFHSDNGSEYINGHVVALLNKLIITLTKNRARHSNDNALVEGKHAWIIRKWLGYGYLSQKHAEKINHFYRYFNEYINYHRPCAFATEIVDKKGKVRKVYKQEDYKTPYEKFRSLPNAQAYLKEGITFTYIDDIAMKRTDNEMAQIVQEERRKLFDEILPIR